MKRVYLMLLAIVLCGSVWADSKLRVAVFDPSSSGSSIDEGTKVAIREIISSTIVNAGSYDIVERSLLEKVMQEQKFSNSGLVDDNDATEIGKLAGANKVILSVVTSTGGRNMLSVKIIDVKTASVERQKVKVVASGELLDVVEPITLALVDTSGGDGDDSVITASAGMVSGHEDKPVPKKNEIVFYLAPGYQPKKEKEQDTPVIVRIDKEDIGSGTFDSGFTIRFPREGGIHKLQIYGQFPFTQVLVKKVDLDKYNFFEFQIYSWVYLGKTLYGARLKEQKKIE